MPRVGHVLLVTWAAGGNTVPAVGLVGELVRRGHDVRVLAPSVLLERFERAGARFRPLVRARAPHLVEEDVFDDHLLAWTRYISGSRIAEDVLDDLGSERTDVAVVDAFLSGALAAVEKARVPSVVLVHVLYEPSVEGPLARQWDPTRPIVESTRELLALPELDPGAPLVAALWGRADKVLVCAPRSFDFPSRDLAANVRYVGPILEDPPRGRPCTRRRTVLVSLSTTEMRQEAVLQRILDAVAGLDAEIVCTLGRIPVPGLRAPAGVTVHDWLPHGEVLPRTAVAVTHAGLSTVMGALVSAVPLVCLPFGRDQPVNARRVEMLGLGESLSTDSPEREIESSVRAVLGDPSYAERAAAMAEDIARYGAGAVAVAEVESLL
ncbi:MAG: glycosyltransferase [Actinomycetota bacterium]|nr:glycosyltransferase [Actinomycetota bacterium]